MPNLFWVLDVNRIVWEVASEERCRVFCPIWQSDTRIRALADDLIGRSGLLFPSAFTRLELNSCSCYRGVAAKDDLSSSWQSKHLCSGHIYRLAALSSVFISFLFVSNKTAKKQTHFREDIMQMLLPYLAHSEGCFSRTQNALWAN